MEGNPGNQGFIAEAVEMAFPGWTSLSFLAFLGLFLTYMPEQWVHFITSQFISTVEVRVLDDSYNYLMDWVARHSLARNNHRLLASTTLTNKEFAWSDGTSTDNEPDFDFDPDGNDLINHSDHLPTKVAVFNVRPLRWSPAMGVHLFWHKRRLLAFTRSFEDRDSIPYSRRAERLFISCLGRDATILKDLIIQCRTEYLAKEKGRVSIYGANHAGGDEVSWVRRALRPTRPMSTIVLDESIKQRFIDDAQRFLELRTKHWYAMRGIPYRRGYLLSGPPGTGKTSLTLAAAGQMGLGIYMINLSSPKLTEDHLMSLFQNLPPSCIVLLEDIDATSLTRTRELTVEEDDDIDDEQPRHQRRGGISLSALLNVIDGAAAHEGRILVMTSNHTENIDPALLRPGRVDFSVEFSLATSETAANIFKQMFDSLHPFLDDQSSTAALKDGDDEIAAEKKSLSKSRRATRNNPLLEELSVDSLAHEFGRRIPESVFSPADIQGYLLTHRNDPQGAVANVDSWVKNASSEDSRSVQSS